VRVLIWLGSAKDSYHEGLRSAAVLPVALNMGFRPPLVIISGEVPISGFNKRFDHVICNPGIFSNLIFLDLKALIRSCQPAVIIEDSTSDRRLKQRMDDLRDINYKKAFMHITYKLDKSLIMSLRRSSEDEDLYEVEVGL